MPATRDWFTAPLSGIESDEALATVLSDFPEARAQAEAEAKALGLDPHLLFPDFAKDEDQQIQRLKDADREAWQELFLRAGPVIEKVCELQAISDHESKWKAASRVFSHLPFFVARSKSRDDLFTLVWTSAYYSAEEVVHHHGRRAGENSPFQRVSHEAAQSMERLAKSERRLLKCYTIEAKTTGQIAVEFNMPREAVRATLKRVLVSLQRSLATARIETWK